MRDCPALPGEPAAWGVGIPDMGLRASDVQALGIGLYRV